MGKIIINRMKTAPKHLKPYWSKPYCGVQHLGQPGHSYGLYWVTIEDWESFAILKKWFPGCGFNAEEQTFNSLEETIKEGEKYIRKNFHKVKL